MNKKEGLNIISGTFTITELIRNKFPELYANLNETPLFLLNKVSEINKSEFEQYLESLKKQLSDFENGTLVLQMCE